MTRTLLERLGKRKVVLVFLSAAVLLAMGALGAWFALLRGLEHCESYVEQRIPGPNGYEIRVLQETCEGLSSTDTEIVILSSNSGWRKWTLFVYGRKVADPGLNRQDVGPTITWTSDTEIKIAIDIVTEVSTKVERVDGIKINYDIGAVEYR
jgi:hypothetical protein